MSEDDLLNLDVSYPDRLIDVLSSSRFCDLLDSKIKERLDAATVDEKSRNIIICSAMVEQYADDENEDEVDDQATKIDINLVVTIISLWQAPTII